MSLVLHRIGLWVHDHARSAAVVALLALTALIGLASAFGGQNREVFAIPGSEAQSTLDTLSRRFPQTSRASSMVVIQAPLGKKLSRAAVAEVVAAGRRMTAVTQVTGPFDTGVSGALSRDGTAGIVTMQLDRVSADVTDELRQQLIHTGDSLRAKGYTVETGGDAFGLSSPAMGVTELAGTVVALLVLLRFFRSIRAAATTLISAATAVAATLALITLLCAATDVSSSTTLLAVMIGMAVGIDYSLFLVQRFRDVTREHSETSTRTAVGITMATAGSAVVFAAVTVLIALAGMSIVGLPFLTVLGLSAAVGVCMGLVATLGLIPILLARWGDSIRDRAATDKRGHHSRNQLWEKWIRAVTRFPLLTVLIVVAAMAALALPARELTFSLPDAGDTATSTTQRRAFDLVEKRFGPGQNGPLMVSADLISTTDPVAVMDRLGADLATVDGVERVALSTSNPKGEMGVVVIIPSTGPKDPATGELVQRLRDLEPTLDRRYDVTTRVTGSTAAAFDVSTRLQDAMAPYCLIVVGLCLVLMTIVFRSLVVPLTAAAGYLLSLAATMGLVSRLFHHGPVISFLPLIVMGVLFGLAMDYQMFLVSRMHEEYADHGDSRAAVIRGFTSSGPVVGTATIIMVAVFAFFIPHGNAITRPVAAALTIGVALDAFVVRMVLVPALLALLGQRSWAVPRALGTRLPNLDVAGTGIKKVLEADIQSGAPAVDCRDVTILGPAGPSITGLTWSVPTGHLGVLAGPEGTGKTSALLAISGRLPFQEGEMSVLGHLLPYEAATVRSQASLAEFAGVNDLEPGMDLDHHIAERYAATRLQPWARREDLTGAMDLFYRLMDLAKRESAATGHTKVAELTALERKVFSLTLACLDRSPLILVDDIALPAAMDRQSLWQLLHLLPRKLSWNPTIIVASHDVPESPESTHVTHLVLSLRAQPAITA